MKKKYDIIVIGGGPAGIMAAGKASESGAKVLLIEKTYQIGNKLLLTGGRRCNIANNASLKEFISAFGKNGKFLYRAFNVFSKDDLVGFFSARGLAMRTGPDGKVFPSDNSAQSVLNVLRRYIEDNKVAIWHNTIVTEIVLDSSNNQVKGVKISDGSILEAKNVIIATGGESYPETGSTGDGYVFAKQCGHTIVPVRPALIPLESDEDFIKELQGLTLKDIEINVIIDKIKTASEQGDLMFTHFGVTGPKILILSGLIVDALERKSNVLLSLNLMPKAELSAQGSKTLMQYLKGVLPKSFVPVFANHCGVNHEKKCSSLTRQERKTISDLFADFRIHITKPRPIEEATITRGGVSLNEINPQTMESKIIKGLYFCGEVLDLDGITGGFNLQEAFSTGYLAGESATLPP